MFDFSWSELALIAIVALVVIGPKDLPRVMKNVAFWVRKARSMAREFQGSIEEMMREAELDDVKRGLDEATRFNFDEEMSKTIDPGGELKRSLSAPEPTNPATDEEKSEQEKPDQEKSDQAKSDQPKPETPPDALAVTPEFKPGEPSPPGQDLAEAGQAVLPPDHPQEPNAEPPPIDRSKPS
jgi:sec-independent protein translocase protein TatB